MRLVLIEWIDSFGCSSHWSMMEDVHPTVLVCRSVGWLLHDGEDCKTIVPHVAPETEHTRHQGCGDMTIPTRCIRSIRDLPQDPNDDGPGA